MPFFPLLLPFTWLIGIASIALLGGGFYLLWLWLTGAIVGTAYLTLAALSLVWSLAGRWIVLALFGRSEDDEPDAMRTGSIQRIRRPDGSELHAEWYGSPDGETIVLAPGWGIDSTEFYYLKRRLGDRFRVLTWDPRGLGLSRGPTDDDYSLERMADDLDAVIAHAGRRRPVLVVGHSLGGMIILTFLRKYAADVHRRVLGVVLANTTYTNPVQTTTASHLMRALQTPVLTPLLYLTIWLWPAVWVMNWLSYLNGSSHISAAWSGFAGSQSRGQLDFAASFSTKLSPAVVARGYLASFEFDETATLNTLTMPTLVLTSDTDRVCVPEVSRLMHRAIPGSELLELESAGHLSLLEQHERFEEAIVHFHDRLSVAMPP